MVLLEIIRDLFGYVALVTTIIGLMLQIYKTYKTKSARDLSSLMLWNCFVCASSWLIYGVIQLFSFVRSCDVMVLLEIVRDLFGYIALITTIIGLMPQIYKTYKTKSARDLSSLMLWNCFVCA
ncbi:MAG: PQ-loop repeat-containing protein, partial [Alphaproteobacteria bacterium]|nr:PQ-loop repeat-containing protein [Alphaproteobacteria bacterium]